MITAIVAAAGDAWADECDEHCHYSDSGFFEQCLEPDIGPPVCLYTDGHWFTNPGGSCT